ncbi:MAG: flagellar hook-length control protein FliK [Planctomycetaceae bacterium]|jgi:flagellar hook-length control protein FliK|nr:flagellar hook-length control protein FliK [Planctomycetaceae bacterium]
MSIVTPDSSTPLYVLPKNASADTLGRALFAEQLGRMMSDGLLKPNENITRDRTKQIAAESIRERNVTNQKLASKNAVDNLLQERQNTKTANQDLADKNIEKQQRTEQRTQARLTKNQTERNDNQLRENVSENKLTESSPINNAVNNELNNVLPMVYKPLVPQQTTLANAVNSNSLAQNIQTQPTAINPLSQVQSMQTTAVPQPIIVPPQQSWQIPQTPQQSIAVTIFSTNGKSKDDENCDDSDTIEKESEQKSKKKTKKMGLFSELLQSTLPPQTERTRPRQGTQRSINGEQVIQTSIQPQQKTEQQPQNASSNNIQNENNDDNRKQREERITFIRRVAAAMQSAAQQNGIIKIRMHPEVLGSVMLRAKMKENRITAHLFVESEDAKRLLLENMPELESNLSKQGVTIEEFKVQIFFRGD